MINSLNHYSIMIIGLTILSMNDASTLNRTTINNNKNIYLINGFLKIDPNHYNKWIEPDTTVNVSVNMIIDPIVSYNDLESLLRLQAIFELKWTDLRLNFNCQQCEVITGSKYLINEIWKPNLHISRSKDVNIFESIQSSRLIYFQIDCNGRILIRYRTNLNIICLMDDEKNLFDNQTCLINITSSDLTNDKLQLKWYDNVKLIENINNLQTIGQSLSDYELYEQKQLINNQSFSMLMIELKFEQQYLHSILKIFLPSSLILVTSWISFWIDIQAVAARVSICVTTMLALVTVSKQAKSSKVQYLNAIDVWFIGCILWIFFALIEYVIVCYVYREERNKLKFRKQIKRSLSVASFSLPMDNNNNNNNNNTDNYNDDQDKQNNITNRQTNNLMPIIKDQRFKRRFSYGCPNLTILPQQQQQLRQLFENRNQQSILESALQVNNDNNQNSSSNTNLDRIAPLIMKDTPQEIAESIDRKCRLIFPLTFMICNLIFWTNL